MAEWYCLVNKEKYGPVDETEIRQWVAEGRLGPDDYVVQPGMTEWVKVSATPQFAAAVQGAQGDLGGSSVVAPPSIPVSPTRSKRRLTPHRGGTVLTLGIIGLVCCASCGIIAWVMGSGDLKKMSDGSMDPSGRGLTQAGYILGIVGTILWVVGIVAQVFMVALATASY
jgi:hypothetical protein